MRQRLAKAILVMAAAAIVPAALLPATAEARPRAVGIFPAPLVAPANLMLLPRGVYYHRAPSGVDVFFAGGFWWAPWAGAWYRSTAFDGPWSLINAAYVPQDVFLLPPRVPVLLPRATVVPWATWRAGHRGNGYGHGYAGREAGRDRGFATPPHRVDRNDRGRPGIGNDRPGRGPSDRGRNIPGGRGPGNGRGPGGARGGAGHAPARGHR